MMKIPLIGVTPLWDNKLQSVWMLSEYMYAIRIAGGIPVVLPLKADKAEIRQMVSTFDGFLFTGGQDVNACPERWALESALLETVLDADKPVFGICRGLQFINAALGGTLWQDLPSIRSIIRLSKTWHLAWKSWPLLPTASSKPPGCPENASSGLSNGIRSICLK